MNHTIGERHPIFEGIDMGIGAWSWGDRLFWGYGGTYGEEDVRASYETSLELGIRFIDTAEIYAQGTSESMLGKFMQTSEFPLIVATKFMPYPWRLRRADLLRALKNSLTRLKMEQVELYQIHQPLPPVKPEVWMEAMVEAFQAGLIKAVGVSNYDRAWMQRAHDRLVQDGIGLASNQVEYHLLNRSVEKNGLLKHCEDLGICLISYSPLAMGVLTGKYTPENPLRGIRGGKYSARYLAQVQPLIKLLIKTGNDVGGKSASQVALNWLICKGTLPIPGVKTARQAQDNGGALGWRLSDDQVAALDEMSDRVMQR